MPATLFLVLHIVYRGDEAASVRLTNAYYYLRFASIVFNFATFLVIAYRARLIKSKSALNKSPVEVAINVLSLRMIYYPLMQAATVLPASIYESLYGIHQNDPTDAAQFTLDCIFAITAPSAGIGYLVIFLVMQPNAYKHFRMHLSRGLAAANCCCKPDRQQADDQKVNVFGTRDNGLVTVNSSTDGPGLSQLQLEDGADHLALLYDRFQDMEEEELAREINKRTESAASDRSSAGCQTTDFRMRADNLSS